MNQHTSTQAFRPSGSLPTAGTLNRGPSTINRLVLGVLHGKAVSQESTLIRWESVLPWMAWEMLCQATGQVALALLRLADMGGIRVNERRCE